jgi:hypothetical protein
MLEIWQKNFAPKDQQKEISCVTSNMLVQSKAEIGSQPDPEKIRVLISQKQVDLERLLSNMEKQ